MALFTQEVSHISLKLHIKQVHLAQGKQTHFHNLKVILWPSSMCNWLLPCHTTLKWLLIQADDLVVLLLLSLQLSVFESVVVAVATAVVDVVVELLSLAEVVAVVPSDGCSTPFDALSIRNWGTSLPVICNAHHIAVRAFLVCIVNSPILEARASTPEM